MTEISEMMKELIKVLTEMKESIDALAARHLPPPPQPPQRVLRWDKMDSVFTNLENIASYKAAKAAEERRKAGRTVASKDVPYNVPYRPTIGAKIENYRAALTDGKFNGGRGRYHTRTINIICDFAPTDDELDEAAAYYATH